MLHRRTISLFGIQRNDDIRGQMQGQRRHRPHAFLDVGFGRRQSIPIKSFQSLFYGDSCRFGHVDVVDAITANRFRNALFDAVLIVSARRTIRDGQTKFFTRRLFRRRREQPRTMRFDFLELHRPSPHARNSHGDRSATVMKKPSVPCRAGVSSRP
jgi:hypothetical protein